METYILEYRYYPKNPETIPYTCGEHKFEAPSDVYARREAHRFLREDSPEEADPREFVRLLKVVSFTFNR